MENKNNKNDIVIDGEFSVIKVEDGLTARDFAAKLGHQDIVDLIDNLNAHGNLEVPTAVRIEPSDFNFSASNNDTALHYATKENKKDIVELLITAGADPSIKNQDGETALDVAKKTGNKDIIEILESHSGNQNQPQKPEFKLTKRLSVDTNIDDQNHPSLKS